MIFCNIVNTSQPVVTVLGQVSAVLYYQVFFTHGTTELKNPTNQ